jgi:Zn-dependent protease with chaperone function
MTLDRANRSFLALIATGVVVGAFTVWGGMADVLEPMMRARVSAGLGSGALVSLLPAALLVAVVGVSTALGCVTLIRQVLATARLSRQVRRLRAPLTGELRTAAERTGLTGRVDLVDAAAPFCYVYRALRPRVVVSRGLLATVSELELRAVLEHERYHVDNLDPLKLALIQATRSALFMLPILQSLLRRYLTARELAADRQALDACGRGPLAAALLKVVHEPLGDDPRIVAAIAEPALLDTRIHQLETGRESAPATFGRQGLAVSVLAAMVLTVTFLVAVWSLDTPVSLAHTTAAGVVMAILVGGAVCAAPFAALASLAYVLIALRARTHRR